MCPAMGPQWNTEDPYLQPEIRKAQSKYQSSRFQKSYEQLLCAYHKMVLRKTAFKVPEIRQTPAITLCFLLGFFMAMSYPD